MPFEHLLLSLTADEIRVMPAGERLDRLVNKCCPVARNPGRHLRPSTDANDAMSFIAATIGEMGGSILITDRGWEVNFSLDGDEAYLVVVEDVVQLPLAVCRAALLEACLFTKEMRRRDLEEMATLGEG